MINLLENKDYRLLTKRQTKELIEFLAHNVKIFNITANIQGVIFTPKLPKSIYDKFGQFVLFTLTNYTLESLIIEDDYITFEAGFGVENFGSTCKIATEAIFQISIENSILFLNPNATINKNFFEEFKENEQKQRSLNAFSFKNNKR